MAHTITSGATVITPDAVDEYESSSTPGNLVHEVINRVFPDATLRPASSRKGPLMLTFSDQVASRLAEQALATAAVWTYTAPIPELSMTFIVHGDELKRRWLRTGRWVLEVPFREVSP